MLKPVCMAKEFEKYGFKMLFVSNKCFEIIDWKDNDPRIHKKANCKYRDTRDALDIVYDLIKAGMLTK